MKEDVYETGMRSAGDLTAIFSAQEQKRRWMAEKENASARVELARINEGCATLLSGHDPVASLGMNRDHLRVLLAYVRHGDKDRMQRELRVIIEKENQL